MFCTFPLIGMLCFTSFVFPSRIAIFPTFLQYFYAYLVFFPSTQIATWCSVPLNVILSVFYFFLWTCGKCSNFGLASIDRISVANKKTCLSFVICTHLRNRQLQTFTNPAFVIFMDVISWVEANKWADRLLIVNIRVILRFHFKYIH